MFAPTMPHFRNDHRQAPDKQPPHRLARLALAILSTAAMLPALADVVPPSVWAAQKRMDEHPRLYDRVDQFCKGHQVNASCSMPGTRAEGGGKGICDRQLDGDNINLQCRQLGPPLPNRIPDTLYATTRPFCAEGNRTHINANGETEEIPDSNGSFTCGAVPLAVDPTCQGKQPGNSCQISSSYDGANELSPGVCTKSTQSRGVRYPSFPVRAIREVISCEPLHHVQRSWSKPSFFDKLFM